jgi:type IV secretory pathway VirD2 relaxase
MRPLQRDRGHPAFAGRAVSDDEFEPRLGRIGSRSGQKGRRYLGLAVAAAARAGRSARSRGRRFDGSRIGRGAALGRLLSTRDRYAALRMRRAVVKTRLVRLGRNGLSGTRAHLRYLQRDSVTREGLQGRAYSAGEDAAGPRAFLERSAGDRHQFRLIVSAEDGAKYEDLKPLTRRLMAQLEADLGTRLEWVAVDHFDTGRPHTHILLRGVDERGENLVIAREYIAHGIRARAAELVTLDLGPRTTRDIEARLRQDISAERLTGTDRQLLRGIDAERTVSSVHHDPFQQSLRAGRLRVLKRMGLADQLGGGRWRLAEGLEATLRAMGERGDIVRTMQRELTARRLERQGAEQTIFGVGQPPVIGRVIARGLADELRDRHYLLVDGVDGRAHYVDIGAGSATAPLPERAIVRVAAREPSIRDADRTVAEVAAASGGYYSADLHLRHDARAGLAFAEAHVRRLDAMRRAGVGVEREPDGRWRIAADHLALAQAYEARQLRSRPVEVTLLSAIPLEKLPGADAATWLDRECLAGNPLAARDAGFGREVRHALEARRQWLVEQGLAELEDGQLRVRANLLALLERRELRKVAGALADELGLAFAEPRPGAHVEGRLARRLDLASGRYAVIENAKEFTLVPWRPALEQRIGREVSGVVREGGISWHFGRGRRGPEIS